MDKEYDLNKMSNYAINRMFDDHVKDHTDKIKEALFETTKKIILKQHGKKYDVIEEKEDDRTIIRPEDGKEELAFKMEFGSHVSKEKGIPAWQLVWKLLHDLEDGKMPNTFATEWNKVTKSPKGSRF